MQWEHTADPVIQNMSWCPAVSIKSKQRNVYDDKYGMESNLISQCMIKSVMLVTSNKHKTKKYNFWINSLHLLVLAFLIFTSANWIVSTICNNMYFETKHMSIWN